MLIWIEKQGWIHLSNTDRRQNYTESLGKSSHYANKGRPISHVVLGKPPALAAVLRAYDHTIWVAFVVDTEMYPQIPLQGWTCCLAAGSPDSGQPPTVNSVRVCLTGRQQPFPRWCPSWGSPHLVTEWGGDMKAWSLGPNVGHSDGKYSLWSSLPGWPRFASPVSQCDFLLCQFCFLPLPFTGLDPLLTKLGLNAYLWRAQPVAATKLSNDSKFYYGGWRVGFDCYVLVFHPQSDSHKWTEAHSPGLQDP